MQHRVMFEVLFFVVVIIGMISIDHRLNKSVKIQREPLNDLK